MQSPRVAVLHFSTARTCFISVPSAWVKEFKLSQLEQAASAVFEVSGDGGQQVFATWSGEAVRDRTRISLAQEDVVEISGMYGQKLGLKHGQEVLVKLISGVPSCTRLHVEPVSVDDWEILELHASYIESHLLDQVRVVWTGQVLPVWVQGNTCIFVQIGLVDPSAPCVCLEQQTELVVAPRTRNGPKSMQTNQNTLNDTKQKMTKDMLNTPSVADSNSDETDSLSTKTTSQDDDQTGVEDYARKSYFEIFWSYLQSLVGRESTENMQNVGRTGSERPDRHVVCDFDFTTRVQAYPDRYIQEAMQHRTAETDESKVAKVDRNAEVGIKEHLCSLDMFPGLLQPMTVVIPKGLSASPSDWRKEDVTTFLAVMTKIQSPLEQQEEAKKNLLQQGAERLTYGQNPSKGKDLKKEVEKPKKTVPNVNSCVVRVVTTACNVRTIDENAEGDSLGRVCLQNGVESQVTDLARRQIGVGVTSKARMSPVRHEPLAVKGIILHPLHTLPSSITKEMLVTAFHHWLSCVSDVSMPLPVTQGTLIRLALFQDLMADCLLVLSPHPTKPTPSPVYTLLHPDMIGTVRLEVGERMTDTNKPSWLDRPPHDSEHEVDGKVPVFRLQDLGGVSENAQQAMDHLTTTLAECPLVSQLSTATRGLANGGLLLCGARGSGKTVLAHALCRELAEPPHNTYVSIVNCKSLKVKRVDNIRKKLEEAVSEATWHQPSVILLDDLDHVTSNATSPEQEMSGEAMYSSHLAQVVRDIVEREIRAGTRLALIATCQSKISIHPSLIASRGLHVFQSIVEIKPPNAQQREEILQAILTARTALDLTSWETVELKALASQTDGFVARDLEAVVDRAIHTVASQKVKLGHENEEFNITTQDFKAALEGFVPCSLHGVSLHKAEDLSWSDVGGLDDIKHTLMETLQWPTKYPGLFSSCPLRPRSGVLLYGAPGTGKTLLAGVVAKECGMNFISIKGPELLSKYIGASEQAVRDLFVRAQAAKPCVLFFDEFDSIAPRRGHDNTGVTDRVVNQFLTQLDGVEGLQGVYVLSATSRPDLIDPALLRPGRLDKCLHCPLPDKEDRVKILMALSKDLNLSEDVDLDGLSEKCQHFTGADFKALFYNAQLEVIHSNMGVSALYGRGAGVDESTGVQEVDEQQGESKTTCISGMEAKVMLMPSLQEGKVKVQQDRHEKLLEQVAIICRNWDGDEDPTGDTSPEESSKAPMIHQEHLMQAATTMRPSVSETERLKYQMIYENFMESRGGNFQNVQSTSLKKTTLA
ncbi:PEX1 [Branchiostoma lanceolatum]|uniref:Peroxisomal ATPase PEX1 n=2 Tax=Branchiostoma lanceolatum TaxID=7740 RepID=A0A8K0A2G9_BRALA|nr:PEX1 [Branchiostoma lanceolatum]